MKPFVKQLISNKDKTVPVLSFPSTQLLGISVSELISSSENQAKGMLAIAERCPVGASLNMMDLSVEAEAFGAEIRFEENEIPTVTKGILDNIDAAAEIAVPEIGAGRTQLYIDGVFKAKQLISDIPVFCGVIGPYSLAGRLFDMTELMMACYDSPESVCVLLEKCVEFIVNYITAYKAAGANGVILAEPAAGLLSPDLCEEFSSVWVKKIIEAVSSDDFVFVYHNCGNTVLLADSLKLFDADVYHFGNAINLKDIISLMPEDKIVMGNVDPVLFKTSSPDIIREETLKILNDCSSYKNFMISSGCDIPAESRWENIDAYFKAVAEFYL